MHGYGVLYESVIISLLHYLTVQELALQKPAEMSTLQENSLVKNPPRQIQYTAGVSSISTAARKLS
jgi:hypothetical protein